MTLKLLISVLNETGFDVQPDNLMDALWLTQLVGKKPRNRRKTAKRQLSPQQPTHPEFKETKPVPPEQEWEQPTGLALDEFRPIFIPNLGTTGRRVSPIAIPAARALPDRLKLMRALRPLCRRWPSGRVLEIDEEDTAQQTAEWRSLGSQTYYPVFRPQRECWFELELVLEDDSAIELWRESLHDFSKVLADTGGFRRVRLWRLRLGKATKSGHFRSSFLESPAGGQMPAGVFSGGTRRLILFASHGSSPHWRSGVYPRLLKAWAADSGVSLLHLLSKNMWIRTALGAPHGVCWTHRPVENEATLDVSAYWWADVDVSSRTLALPVLPLEASAVRNWAAMQMGRSSPNPVYLLDTSIVSEPDPPTTIERASDLASRVNALKATPQAFRLAVILSVGPFTIPVARLVLEATFGRVDHYPIAQLLLSGLIRAYRPAIRVSEHQTTIYEIDRLAVPILQRSLHESELKALSADIFDAVSNHLARTAGRHATTESFTPDENGRYRLPDGLQAFARFVTSLRTKPGRPQNALAMLNAFLRTQSRRSEGRLARIATSRQPLTPSLMNSDIWDGLLLARISDIDAGGERRFYPAVQSALAGRATTHPLLGVTILWVDDRPSNNVFQREHFRSLGAEVSDCPTTAKAVELLGTDQFDLVISDMGRREDGREVSRAGFDLLKRVNTHILPVIIFAGEFASSAVRRDEALAAGAFGCTNRDDVLEELVRAASQKTGPYPVSVVRKSWREFWNEGVDHANARRNQQALEAYMMALELAEATVDNNERAKLQSYISAMLKRLGRLSEAEEYARAALRIAKDETVRIDALYNLACVQALSGNRDPLMSSIRELGRNEHGRNMIRSNLGNYFADYAEDFEFLKAARINVKGTPAESVAPPPEPVSVVDDPQMRHAGATVLFEDMPDGTAMRGSLVNALQVVADQRGEVVAVSLEALDERIRLFDHSRLNIIAAHDLRTRPGDKSSVISHFEAWDSKIDQSVRRYFAQEPKIMRIAVLFKNCDRFDGLRFDEGLSVRRWNLLKAEVGPTNWELDDEDVRHLERIRQQFME
ncbi:SAV_2336 N-terminal domain-related protein [Candidatus Phyllobacterium onerii]|uniref:SAV_2336 N-terminal domain-related protein n=1 Tax=Candidatus Phyllobacterium onerii TaxID=3020828 RepID=UPI00233122FE|nr:SAV_2336 N-terminal domain-related protein [Phyllobacterium sp. IY22]